MKNLTFMPKTGLGKLSFKVLIAFVFSLSLRIFHLEMGGFGIPLDGLLEILFFFLEYATGAVAFLLGLVSVLAKGERSILVFLYTGLPLIAILFLLLGS